MVREGSHEEELIGGGARGGEMEGEGFRGGGREERGESPLKSQEPAESKDCSCRGVQGSQSRPLNFPEECQGRRGPEQGHQVTEVQ